jgi:signal transduction histidine kinase/CheY-like chemotaxis protein
MNCADSSQTAGRSSTRFERFSDRFVEFFLVPIAAKLKCAHPLVAVLVTTVLIEVFVGIRALLDPYIGTYAPLFILTLPVLISALFLGVYHGFFATMLAMASGLFFLIEPRFTFQTKDPNEVPRIAIFVVLSVIFSIVAGAFHETSRRVRAERNHATDASRAKSEFLSNMSHEIRTPLAAIVGFADLLDQEKLSEEDRKRFSRIILRNGYHLNELLNSVLDIAKIESGHLQVESVPVSVSELCAEITSLMRLRASEKGVRLSVERMDPALSKIFSDPLRLRQIIQNLIGNAVKFTQKGEVAISTHVIAQLPDGEKVIGIQVRDTGIGIPIDKREAIFEPFAQADSSTTRQYGGTGLGLPLARKLAQALGGDLVLLDSEPGRGSTFLATFKARPDLETQPAVQEKALAQKNGGLRGRHLNGVRILLAEDSPDNQLLIKRYLGAEGAKVESVDDGLRAVQTALSKDFDLVLMDIQMPELDGYDATRKLRNENYKKPIVALTAHALADERAKCISAGCTEYLTKPVDKMHLVSLIRSLVPVLA